MSLLEPLDFLPQGPPLNDAERLDLLKSVLHGIDLGTFDEDIVFWLSGMPDATVRTVASLLARCRADCPPDELNDAVWEVTPTDRTT